MDMMPPICDVARRCIHTMTPMISSTGSSSGASCCQKLGSKLSNLTPSEVMNFWSSSGGGLGAVDVKRLPSVNVPVMLPVLLSNVASLTLSSLSAVMNSP